MLAGEASVDGGELVLAKGAKVALHDQRPPRDRRLSLRDYVLSGAPELVAIEQELAALEQPMADGAYDEATLTATPTPRRALEHAGGYNWRERALATLHGLGFRDDADLDRSLETFSGGELTRASLGRALAGDPDLLLLDEPTNHLDIESLEWLEQHLIALDAAVVLVAHDRWFLEAVGDLGAGARGGARQVLPGHLARVAHGEGAARAGARARDRAPAGRDRRGSSGSSPASVPAPARARRSRAPEAARQDRPDRRGPSAIATGSAFAFKPPERSGRVVFESRGRAGRASASACS